MERPVFQPVGTPENELDTPALLLDLDVATSNIHRMHQFFGDTNAKVRPHVGCHQCPRLAHLQMAAGGTVGGIAVTTVGEAEVFSDAGFNDILVTSEVVTRPAIRRLCELAQLKRITVAVDHPRNVADLSEAAADAGVVLRILVELDAGMGRCGVAPGPASLELARGVNDSAGLEFSGLMANEGPVPNQDWENAANENQRRLQSVVDTRELIEREGLPVPIVSVGGTYNYDTAGRMSGVTEVQAGIYPLMDHRSSRVRPEFVPAAKILSEVISHPIESRAIVDAGHKATGPDEGLPVVEGIPGATASRFSAEHGILDLKNQAVDGLRPGEKVWLVPFDLALTVNQFDYFRAVRQGKLVGFWPIAARGRFA
ncbi:MAG: alanine racemase [Dehalococcoidia bacterium]